MIRVAVYQPVIPEYRVPFFSTLSNIEDMAFTFFASREMAGCPPTSQRSDALNFIPCNATDFLHQRLFWQSGVKVPQDFQKGDVVVIGGNPRFLSNYPVIFTAKARGVGVVWWTHGHTPGPLRLTEKIRHKLMRLGDVFLLYTDKEISDYIQLGFPADRLFAMNNTIETGEIDSAMENWDAERLADFKKEHGLTDGKVILYCGRLSEKSEFDVALSALKILTDNDPFMKLVAIGDGPMRESLIARARELGISRHVIFTGEMYVQQDLAPWFMASSAFVFPGSIGLSLNHAMAYGLPVITHGDVLYHGPEISALENGVNGMLFRRGDADDLARCVRHVITDARVRDEMAHNASMTMRGRFSFSRMVDGFMSAVKRASQITALS